jgi:hypothetical protein
MEKNVPKPTKGQRATLPTHCEIDASAMSGYLERSGREAVAEGLY